MDRTDEATKVLYSRIIRNCALYSRCKYNMTLNQDIFLRIFPRYGLMGERKKQGFRKIERAGSRLPIKVGLVRRGATYFTAPWMIGGFAATSLLSVTEDTKGVADKVCNY